MWKWLQRTRAPPTLARTELRGAPRTVRQKTYSALSGYVYQYVYRGFAELTADDPGRLFVFSATRDRTRHFDVRIALLERQLCQAAPSTLSNAELYAVAKMTLFGAFDECVDIALFEQPVTPNAAAIGDHLITLGRL